MSRQENRATDDDERIRSIIAAAVADAEATTRREIGRALHDDLQQQLYSLRVRIETVRDQCVRDRSDGQLVAALDGLGEQADRTLEVVHRIARALDRPSPDDGDLAAGLERLRDEMKVLHGLDVDIERAGGAAAASPAQSPVVLRCVRELLFNVTKHAGTDNATVRADRNGEQIVLVVGDDGDGFSDPPDGPRTGVGLATVQEQLLALGGTLDISSTPGRGTTVTMSVPIAPTPRHPSG